MPTLKTSLTISPLGEELVVFDDQTQRAHCLNRLGRQVFEACRQGADLASLGLSPEELDSTLVEFAQQGLLEQEASSPSRRRFLVGASGAALAITASVLSPRPASAMTCIECLLDAVGLPLDCADCGQPCVEVLGDDCAATSVCCFEFRRNRRNNRLDQVPTGDASQCQGLTRRENIGQFECRNTEDIPFHQDCNTMRDAVLNGRQYYCCCCPGIASSADIPLDGCC